MASIVNHRYRILEKIGEGGAGEAFLVEDTLLSDRRCAMKVLHTAESPAEVEAFRQEVSVLTGLHHPNLISMYDFGVVRSADISSLITRRFFTMEYLDGKDSLVWFQNIDTQDDRDRLLETLLSQALGVLSYIHREGIVHFDIKPQNLMVINSEESKTQPVLKLMDFGFSTRQDASAEITLRGTLEYTAPELLRGEAGDSRIDLYSLGATFFQLLEGRCPFEASESVELIKKVLSDEASFSASAPAHLVKVLKGLLEKDPSMRYHSAGDAARILASGKPLDPHSGSARKPKFVGRNAERSLIESAITTLRDPSAATKAAAFVLSGPEGIGKTALLAEMSTLARGHDVLVMQTEVAPNGIPFRAMSPVLNVLRAESLSFSKEGGAIVAKYARVFEGDAPESRDARGLQLKEWARNEEQLIELSARFVIECANVFPLIIVADNIHLMEQQSLRVLQTIMRDAPRGKIVVLAAETGDQVQSIPSDIMTEIRLQELDLREVIEMNGTVLDHAPAAEELGSSIYRLYGGTPAVVVEALHTLAVRLPRDILGDRNKVKEFAASIENTLPKNVEGFFVERYRQLNRERQLVMDMLACFQGTAHINAITGILPFQRQRAIHYLGTLELEGHCGSSDGGRRYFIRIGRLKKVVYDLIQENRNDLHLFIASTLERMPLPMTFADLQELGYQFSACENSEKSSLYYERAADEGLRSFAVHRSRELYEEAAKAAAAAGDAGGVNRIRGKLSEALFHAGRYKESIEMAEGIVKANASELKSVPLVKTIGLAQSRLGEFDRARQNLLKVLDHTADETSMMEIRQELVGIEISVGHYKDAEQTCLMQLDNTLKLGNDLLTATIYTDLGIATFLQDRFDEAVAYFHKAREEYSRMKNPGRVADTMINIGNAMSAKGDIREAINCWEVALGTSEEFGMLNQQAQIQNNLGIAHYNLKQYAKAKGFYTAARSIFEKINSKSGLAYALTNLGEVFMAEGEYERALGTWTEASGLYRAMGDVRGLTETFLQLAFVWWVLGDMDSMSACIQTAKEHIDTNDLDTFEPQLNYLNGILHNTQRDFASAIELLGKAKAGFLASSEMPRHYQARLMEADCLHSWGRPEEAVVVLVDLLAESNTNQNPGLRAEANYILGIIALSGRTTMDEKPIHYFKTGFEIIIREPVSELTWKLAFALAREFHDRGQVERAREHLMKARVILTYFLSQFTSHELKDKYLSNPARSEALSTIDRLTKA